MACPSLSFVVVTWESAADLGRLVDALAAQVEGDAELVVVDNASRRDPEPALAGWTRPRRLERLAVNAGFGTAANRGVELAVNEAVVLINPDARPLDSGLSPLAGFACRNRCLVGPRLVGGDGTRQPSASGPPTGLWPWVGALVPGGLAPAALRRRTEPWRLEDATRVSWLSGACIAAPRDLLARLGPFDPTIHMYAEDMELGLRAAMEGVESWFCPELARVEHRRRGSSMRRWPNGPEMVAAESRREVLRRAAGVGPERRSRRAQMLRLRLRLVAKRALRRPVAAEANELAALRSIS